MARTARTSTGTPNNSNNLAFDSRGALYFAYQDKANGSKATVMKYSDGSWQTVGPPGFTGMAVDYFSLAIDPTSDVPYFAYSDLDLPDGPGKATVVKFAAGSWQVVATAGFSAAAAVPAICVAIDPTTGAPYVAFVDAGNGARVTVMTFDTGSWQIVGSPGFSARAVMQNSLSIAIDTSGVPYVAYAEVPVNPDITPDVTVMKYDGGSWQALGSEDFTSGKYVSLAIAPSGDPYIAFSDLSLGADDSGKSDSDEVRDRILASGGPGRLQHLGRGPHDPCV